MPTSTSQLDTELRARQPAGESPLETVGMTGESARCLLCRYRHNRHTFAVRSLEQCPVDRKAVARHMAALSTYLGHAHVSDTYWYLQATPRLLSDVAIAAEALHQGGKR